MGIGLGFSPPIYVGFPTLAKAMAEPCLSRFALSGGVGAGDGWDTGPKGLKGPKAWGNQCM